MDAKETIKLMKTDEKLTFGQILGPAMKITDPQEANEYLRVMIERIMRREGLDRHQAETQAKSNLGYFGVHCDAETNIRINRLFAAVHPIFGNNFPTQAEAYQSGLDKEKEVLEAE